VLHAIDVRVESGHYRTPAWAAERCRSETAIEANAVGGKSVEVRGLNDRIGVAAEVIPTVIVGND
jgi:hypothetical protein